MHTIGAAAPKKLNVCPFYEKFYNFWIFKRPLLFIMLVILQFFIDFWQLLLLLKLKLITYRNCRLWGRLAQKNLDFLCIYKDFKPIYPEMLMLERNSRFHRSSEFHRSVPLKTEIVPFRSWGGIGTENETERCRARTAKHCLHINKFGFFPQIFDFFYR